MAAGEAPPSGASPGAGGAAPNPQPVYAPQPVAAGGMDDNMAAALSYITIVGIIFLLIDPYNRKPFIRFHAFQSIFFLAAWIVVWIAITIVSMTLTAFIHILALILAPIHLLIWLLFVVLWFFCVYKAYNREWFQIPIIGPIALKQSGAGQPS